MKIKSIHLKNFKRFTDLLIEDIPESAKLVLVVGPNGCGKSSLFDGFLHCYHKIGGYAIHSDESYIFKEKGREKSPKDLVTLAAHKNDKFTRNSFYFRTAHRNDPEFNITTFGKQSPPSQQMNIQRMIQDNKTVSENYGRLIHDTTTAIYDNKNDTKTVKELREELIGQIRESMRLIFGDLTLSNIVDPFRGTFFFEKGSAEPYPYKNLSGGEKSAFDLILDIHVKKKDFPEGIYCIDEIDTHLHTSVQGLLLKELVSIVPDAGQVWVTTHSLGVLRAAQELKKEKPDSVCIIDFDGVDLDKPTKLTPVSLGRVAWEKMLSIALHDLSARTIPEIMVVCEGSYQGKGRKNFDAEIYNKIFSRYISDIVFVSGGSSDEIEGTATFFVEFFKQVFQTRTTKVRALRDRDDMSDAQVQDWEENGDIVLLKRHLESFLFADDVLKKLCENYGKPNLFDEVIDIKSEALRESKEERGNPSDDIKSASGKIYTGLKKLLDLTQCGNNQDAFMRDTLAPLIRARRYKQELQGNTIHGATESALQKSVNLPVDSITKKGTIIFRSGSLAVRDNGQKFQVSHECTQEAANTILQLAFMRYGTCLMINGTPQFKAQIIHAAITLNLPITFSDPHLERHRKDFLKKKGGNIDEKGRRINRCSFRSSGSGMHTEKVGTNSERNKQTKHVGFQEWEKRERSNFNSIGSRPPPESQNRLRNLSQLGVVCFRKRTEVLLPSDVSHNMEQPRTKSTNPLRWHFLRRRVRPESFIAAEKYIFEQQGKRQEGDRIPEHVIYSGEECPLSFSGIKYVDGHALALLKRTPRLTPMI